MSNLSSPFFFLNVGYTLMAAENLCDSTQTELPQLLLDYCLTTYLRDGDYHQETSARYDDSAEKIHGLISPYDPIFIFVK